MFPCLQEMTKKLLWLVWRYGVLLLIICATLNFLFVQHAFRLQEALWRRLVHTSGEDLLRARSLWHIYAEILQKSTDGVSSLRNKSNIVSHYMTGQYDAGRPIRYVLTEDETISFSTINSLIVSQKVLIWKLPKYTGGVRLVSLQTSVCVTTAGMGTSVHGRKDLCIQK